LTESDHGAAEFVVFLDVVGMLAVDSAADLDLPRNRASIALYRASGYRTVGIRERIAQLDGQWRDTVLLERRHTE
jgi:hypothetical protein